MSDTTKEIISMQTKTMKLAHIAVATAVLATAFNLPAVATAHGYHRHHHHYGYGHALTVSRRAYPAAVVAAPDPFHGPGVIITAPVALAATFVSLPFRAVGSVFPATGNTPLVIVGAPAHFAGQVVQFPFYVVGNAFGAAPATY
jgi:hypothetical protein